MTGSEMITDFKLKGASVRELFTAINAHLTTCGIEPEDRGFGVGGMYEDQKLPDPKEYRWLVAFVVEGNSEGYYVHCGAILSRRATAYQIAKEAQRFLTAAAWN